MIGDLFSKLQEARQKIEEAKKSLNEIVVEAQSNDQKIRVKANANKVITSIEISEEMMGLKDREMLENTLLETLNKALEEAAAKGEVEMKKITQGMLPNFPGLV